jgi:NADH:ubiquinone oxidoreductase subunit 2 (subunit N)
MLVMSVILSLRSNSWLFIWIILEFNSIAFIMIILINKEKRNRNRRIKYFLIQSIGSIIILIYFSFFSLFNRFSLNILKLGLIIIIVALFLKIAIAPFHRWIFKLIKNLNFLLLIVLLLWQKLIPIFVLINVNKNIFIIFVRFIAIIIGSLRQFNVSSILIIIVLSSIVHLSWMIVPRGFLYFSSFIYLGFYFILSMLIFSELFKNNIQFLWNQLNKKFFSKFSLIIYSLAGLPPLIGFIPKWIIIILLLNMDLVFIILMFILITSLNFYIYNRLLYSTNIIRNIPIKNDKNLFSLNKFSLNFLFPLLYFIYY